MAKQYGLTLTGFVIPTVDDVRSEIEDLLHTAFGPSLPLGDNTLLGFIVGIIAERLVLLWEFARASWAALDPDSATGAALEAISLLTGTFRIAAAASLVMETLCGDDGTVINAGLVVSTLSTAVRFTTAIPTVLGLLPDWTALTVYAVDDRVTNDGHCYECTFAGTSAASGGPSVTTGTTSDGSVTWQWIGDGTAAVDVPMISNDTGAIVAAAGDLADIATPVGGLNTATNLLDAAVGHNLSSDQELRLLRSDELAASGASAPDAIRATLRHITGVTNAHVFYNNTDVTDADGVPPHSVEALVQGGADQDILDVLFASVVVGVDTIGTTSGFVTDSEGNAQAVSFSRPDAVNVYSRVTLTKDPKTYVGDAVLNTTLATAANKRPVGSDAVASALNAMVFTAAGPIDSTTLIYTDVITTPAAWINTHAYSATPGARSVVTNDGGRAYICITAGTSAGSGGPTGVGSNITDGTAHWAFLGNTIAITARQLAVYDTTRNTIVSTDGTL